MGDTKRGLQWEGEFPNPGMVRQSSSSTRLRARGAPSNEVDQLKQANDTMLLASLRHDLRNIGNEMVVGVMEHVDGRLDKLDDELSGVMKVLTDARDSTVMNVLEQLRIRIIEILGDAGWPLQVDFAGLQEEFRTGEVLRLRSYQEKMDEWAPRLERDPQVLQEILEMKRQQEHLHKETLEALGGSRHEVGAMHDSLGSEIKLLSEEMRQLRQESAQERKEILSKLLQAEVDERERKVDLTPVLNMLKKVHEVNDTGLAEVRQEIVRLKESMHQGITQVQEDVQTAQEHSKGKGEDMWTQTVSENKTEATQTDDRFWKARKNERKKGETTNVTIVDPNSSARELATPKKKRASRVHKGPKVFQDADKMRQQVRKSLINKPPNDFDKYHPDGRARRIVLSPTFDAIVYVVVLLNVIWIGVDVDHNGEAVLINAAVGFQLVEHAFTIFFVGELLVRFLAFREKRDALKDRWFICDSLLVVMMVIETWLVTIVLLALGGGDGVGAVGGATIIRLVRLVKLARLSRLARLVKAIPELIIFVKGIRDAAPTVLAVFVLWIIFVYSFAIMLVQLKGEIGDSETLEALFGTVPRAMNTLLLDGVLADNAPLVKEAAAVNPAFWPLLVAFCLLVTVTLSYMLIGVLCETVRTIASTERERITVGNVARFLREEWQSCLHIDTKECITKAQFQSLLMDPIIARFIAENGVDVIVLVDMFDFVYDDAVKGSGEANDGMSFQSFVDIVLNMRGSNVATVKDVEAQVRQIRTMMHKSLKENYDKVQEAMTQGFNESAKSIKDLRKLWLGEDDSESSKAGSADDHRDDDDHHDDEQHEDSD
jgi:voltage-gated sodium channel